MNPSLPSNGACSPAIKDFQVSRRTFLKKAATVAAMTGLPVWFVERQLLEAAEPPPCPRRTTVRESPS